MDYEMKYKEALKNAKDFMSKGISSNEDAFEVAKKLSETIFPELKETKDNIIRKAILCGIEYLEREMGWDFINDVDIVHIKDYLREPIENENVDVDTHIQDDIDFDLPFPIFGVGNIIKHKVTGTQVEIMEVDLEKGFYKVKGEWASCLSFYNQNYWEKIANHIKEENSEKVWTDKDEKIAIFIRKVLSETPYNKYNEFELKEACKWFTSKWSVLAPQHAWKPTKEQIETLKGVYNSMILNGYSLCHTTHCSTLQSLIDDLEKQY